MPPLALVAIYCFLIGAASLLGGWLPRFVRLTHMRMQLMMSAVGGLMLGVGILHMLPHGLAQSGSLDRGMLALLAGLITTFFMMRVFHFHEHAPIESGYPGAVEGDHRHGGHHHCDHDHGHHHHEKEKEAEAPQRSAMRWLGVFLGLSIHTLLDGIALAAAVFEGLHQKNPASGIIGLGVFLGIFLHKPLDALSITFVMRSSKWPTSTINIVNLGYSLMCPLGVALFFAGYEQFDQSRQMVVGLALCFSAGVFLCLSLADILPEIQFHSHDKVKLSSVLLLGIFAAWLIGFAEPGGLHNHSVPADNQPIDEKTAPQDEEPSAIVSELES